MFLRMFLRWIQRRCRIGGTTVLGTSVVLGVLACSSDTTGPAPLDPTHGYWQLSVNHHAVTLSLTPPYNTLQLVATPLTSVGTPLTDSSVTTWTTSDSNITVSPTGLMTAIAPTSGSSVTVTRTIGSVADTDIVYVNVNDTVPTPALAKLILRQALDTPTEQYLFDVFGYPYFTPAALDARGDTIPNVVFEVTSTTPAIIRLINSFPFSHGEAKEFNRFAAGHALLRVEATVYGNHRVDSLPVIVGWLTNVLVGVHEQFLPGQVKPIGVFVPSEDTVAVGGTVVWRNELSGQALADVVFDDSTAVQAVDSATYLDGFASNLGLVIPTQGGGNIPPFVAMDSTQGKNTRGIRARRFPTAGTYHYHSVLYGTSGVIHVLPPFQVP